MKHNKKMISKKYIALLLIFMMLCGSFSSIKAGAEGVEKTENVTESQQQEQYTEKNEADKTENIQQAESVKADDKDTGKKEAASEEVSYPATEQTEIIGSGEKAITVKASAKEGVLPEGAKLAVKYLSEDSEEYAGAEKTLKDKSVDFNDMVAVDIHFELDGREVQPQNDGKVNVSMQCGRGLFSKDADLTKLSVKHLDKSSGEVQVETVASSDKVTVAEKSVNANFDTGSFSIYVVTDNVKTETTSYATIAVGETITLKDDDGSTGKWYNNASCVSITTSGWNNRGDTCYVTGNSEGTAEITHNGRHTFIIRVVKKPDAGYSYRVTFDKNGGNSAAPSDIQVSAGNEEITLPDYSGTKNGYVFAGWSVSPNVTVHGFDDNGNYNYLSNVYAAGSNYTVQSNVTFYAAWAKKSDLEAAYFIRLDGNVPAEPTPAPSSEYTGAVGGGNNGYGYTTIKNAIKSEYGGAFYANNDAGTIGTIYDEGGVYNHLNNMPTAQNIADAVNAKSSSFKITLSVVNGELVGSDGYKYYVRWYVIKGPANGYWNIDGVLLRKDKVTITYNPNCSQYNANTIPNGTQLNINDTVYVGSNLNDGQTYRTPVRPGYTFLGWSLTKEGQVDYQNKDTFKIQQNTTLYAQWQRQTSNKTVTKIWSDNGYSGRPTEITLNIIGKIGEKRVSEQSVILKDTDVSSGNKNIWSRQIKDLPITDENGNVIIYTIEEAGLNEKYSVSYNQSTLTATNTLKTGGLKVTKKVEGNMGNKTQEFGFTLHLDGYEEGDEVSYVKGTETGTSTVDAYGNISFTLSDGESIEFTGIAEGTEYTVTESDTDSSGYTVTKTNDSGTIAENKTAEVSFTNTKEMAVPTAAHTNTSIFIAAALIAFGGIAYFCFRKKRYV